MNKAQRYRQFNMDVAVRCAAMSHAVKRKTGCIIVHGTNIISHGWNGMPSGYPNECEATLLSDPPQYRTHPEVLHAEENAIGKVAASTQSTVGADLYVTYAPCKRCARLIWRAGIRNVYYLDAYAGENAGEKDGLELLARVGIPAIQLRPDGAPVRIPSWELPAVVD